MVVVCNRWDLPVQVLGSNIQEDKGQVYNGWWCVVMVYRGLDSRRAKKEEENYMGIGVTNYSVNPPTPRVCRQVGH